MGVLENLCRLAAKQVGEESSPLNHLTMGMIIGKKSKPKLKLKAADGRHFLRVLLFLLQNLVSNTTDHTRFRINCVSAIVRVCDQIADWKDGGVSSVVVSDWGRRHLILYKQLSDEADSDRYWCLFPKHHMFAHVADRCTVNPKLDWNYLDESVIGLGAVVAGVSNQEHLETGLLKRYRATFVREF